MSKQVAVTMVAEFDTEDWEDLATAVDEALATIVREFHDRPHRAAMAIPILSADNLLAGRGAIAITEVHK